MSMTNPGQLPHPPPPPPPPPQLPPIAASSSSSGGSSDTYYAPIQEADDAWIESIRLSLKHLPAWKQSTEDSTSEDPTSEWMWVVYNTGISSILQKREQPVCGLLALGMASEMMSLPWKDLWNVVTVAKERGFTCYGEMFSARWLLDLAKAEYGMDGDILEGDLLKKVDILNSHLAKGNPILIAYDTDANFEPCCKKGHKAHWAVLTGFMYKVKQCESQAHKGVFQQDKVIQNLYYLPKAIAGTEDFPLPSNVEDIFVIAKQGKSKRYGLWSYLALCESNSNLEELSPTREADEKNYVIPKNGVKGGLANQAILLQPL